VLLHDRTIDRTTNGKGKVSDYTLEEIKQFRLKDGLGITLKDQTIPTLEEALVLCKDKILINVDKAENYMDIVQSLLAKTDCKRQVVYKGSKSYSKVYEQYGDLLNQIIYMPVVRDSDTDLENHITEFLRSYRPIAFEVLFKKEDSPMFVQMQKMKTAGCRIWINSLWPAYNAGHDDERAAYGDPDEAWGWLIEKGASIIQTDRPIELISYLDKKGLHSLKSKSKKSRFDCYLHDSKQAKKR
jgi:glycerophosphoryl diester phosphodiesterase